jgi:hypothetical protein
MIDDEGFSSSLIDENNCRLKENKECHKKHDKKIHSVFIVIVFFYTSNNNKLF